MNRPEAEQIAAAICMIRPDWYQTSIVTLLGKHHAHRPARDVMLALAWVAFDPETQSPGRINEQGPWWELTRLAGVSRAEVPPPYVPPTPGQVADAATVRRLRELHPIRPLTGTRQESADE